MGVSADIRARCAAIMARQQGLITRSQALSTGLSRRQVDGRLASSEWRRLMPTVYAPAELFATWHQRVIAACLWAGENAAASHATAAHLLGFPGFPREGIEICTPRRLVRAGIVVHQRSLRPRDVVRVDRIPVTSVPRTLVDVAAACSLERLETAVDNVLVRGLTTKDRLQAELDGRLRAVPGSAPLRRVVESYTHAPIESPLERKFLRLLRAAGLPEPEVQYPIYDGDRFLARVDFAYPELRLAIEVDGFRWHGGRTGWAHDLSRGNALINRRWRLLHMTKEHMDGSGATAVALVTEARAVRALRT